jgi:SAM-dependent methyltransferase
MSKDAWLNWYQDRKVEDSVVNFARILKEAGSLRVLDLGCGTGRNTVYLARLGFEVHGFDWSQAAVEICKQELSKMGLDADIRVWDMNETPFPYSTSYFDAVLVMKVMHHTYVEKIRRIAAEIQRLIKRGGFLYVEVPTYKKVLKPLPGGAKSGAEPEPGTFVPSWGDEAGIPHHHFRKEELIALFPEFTPLGLEERNEHYCLTARRD